MEERQADWSRGREEMQEMEERFIANKFRWVRDERQGAPDFDRIREGVRVMGCIGCIYGYGWLEEGNWGEGTY